MIEKKPKRRISCVPTKEDEERMFRIQMIIACIALLISIASVSVSVISALLAKGLI